jgi:hypothetical protein
MQKYAILTIYPAKYVRIESELRLECEPSIELCYVYNKNLSCIEWCHLCTDLAKILSFESSIECQGIHSVPRPPQNCPLREGNIIAIFINKC